MAEVFFRVQLALDTKDPARPGLIYPDVLRGADFYCVIVKEGGEEAIVKVLAPAETLKAIEKNKQCEKLTQKQLENLRKSYPAPKLKKKYRLRAVPLGQVALDASAGRYALDVRGEKIADTYQTVRCDFHLIDVPVSG